MQLIIVSNRVNPQQIHSLWGASVTLQDVGLLVGDEDDKKLLQWLVNISNMIGLDSGVLLSRAGQLGERSNQPLDSSASHLPELTRDEGCVVMERKRSFD